MLPRVAKRSSFKHNKCGYATTLLRMMQTFKGRAMRSKLMHCDAPKEAQAHSGLGGGVEVMGYPNSELIMLLSWCKQ